MEHPKKKTKRFSRLSKNALYCRIGEALLGLKGGWGLNVLVYRYCYFVFYPFSFTPPMQPAPFLVALCYTSFRAVRVYRYFPFAISTNVAVSRFLFELKMNYSNDDGNNIWTSAPILFRVGGGGSKTSVKRYWQVEPEKQYSQLEIEVNDSKRVSVITHFFLVLYWYIHSNLGKSQNVYNSNFSACPVEIRL